MKGFEATILSAFLIVVTLIAVVGLFASFGLFSDRTENLQLRRDVYVMGNALAYGKVMAESAFSYSLFQACHDALQRGGYSSSSVPPAAAGEAVVWYDRGVFSIPDFPAELGKEAARDLALYAASPFRYLKGIDVTLPRDYVVGISLKPHSQLEAKAIASPLFVSRLSEEEGKTVTLLRDAVMERVFDVSCGDIFAEGSRLAKPFAKGTEQLLITEVNTRPKAGEAERPWDEAAALGKAELGDLVMGGLAGTTLAQAEQEITSKLSPAISALLPARSGLFPLTAETLELAVRIEPACTAVKDSRIIAGQAEDVAAISCSFTYVVRLVETVRVTESREEKKLPVFNGQDVAFTLPELLFAVRIELALDKTVSRDVTGTYALTLLHDETPTTQQLSLSQQGNDLLALATPFTETSLVGSGKLLNDFVQVAGLATVVGTEVVKLDLEGTVQADGSISGTFSGTAASSPATVSGTFTAAKMGTT